MMDLVAWGGCEGGRWLTPLLLTRPVADVLLDEAFDSSVAGGLELGRVLRPQMPVSECKLN